MSHLDIVNEIYDEIVKNKNFDLVYSFLKDVMSNWEDIDLQNIQEFIL